MILDATCGLREMWFQKEDPDTIYLDHYRGMRLVRGLYWRAMYKEVKVTVLGDNRFLPFKAEVFDLVIYDPPHRITSSKWTRLKTSGVYEHKYETLEPDFWDVDMSRAARECFRVLKLGGFLVFKWSEHDRSLNDVLLLFPEKPLLGTLSKAETWWILFRKDHQ